MAKKITFDAVEALLSSKPQGISEQQALSALKKRGYEVEGLSMAERFKSSFGDEKSIARMKRAEQLSGQRGKLEAGDIADVAGSALPIIGSLLGTIAGPVGVGAGTAAGEAVKRGVGQALGVRDKTLGQEALGTIGAGVTAGVGAKVIPMAIGGIKKALGGTGKVVAKNVFGEKTTEVAKKAFKDPTQFNAFRTEQKTIEGVASQTRNAISTFRDASKRTFEEATKKIVPKPIPVKDVNTVFTNTAKEFLGMTPEEKLTSKQFLGSFLNREEKTVLNKIMSGLKSGYAKEPTNKNLVKVIRSLDRAGVWREGDKYTQTNAFWTALKRNLNEQLIDKSDEGFAAARKTASENLELLNKLGFNVWGNPESVEATAAKLGQLATRVDTQQGMLATKQLLDQLQQRTGFDVLSPLKAYNASQYYNKVLSPEGLIFPFQTIIKNINRGAIRASAAAGRTFGGANIPTSGGNIPRAVGGLIGGSFGRNITSK
jgi:hypothetical protein